MVLAENLHRKTRLRMRMLGTFIGNMFSQEWLAVEALDGVFGEIIRS